MRSLLLPTLMGAMLWTPASAWAANPWNRVTPVLSPSNLQTVISVGDRVIVGTDDGEILASSDLVTWAALAPRVPGLSIKRLTIIGDRLHAFGTWQGRGVVWREQPSGELLPYDFAGFGSRADGFIRTFDRVVVTMQSRLPIFTSNGTRWEATEIHGLQSAVWASATSGTSNVAIDTSGGLYTSGGSRFWTRRNEETSVFRGAAHRSGLWVAVGHGTTARSVDGTNWTFRASPLPFSDGFFEAVATDGDRFVAVGTAADIGWTGDGINWHAASVPMPPEIRSPNLRDVTWTGSQFIAVGDAGTVLSSADGTQWVVRSFVPALEIRAIAASEDVAVARGPRAGGGGVEEILTSTDGVNWTERGEIIDAVHRAYTARGNELFTVGTVAITDLGARVAVGRSTDGHTWSYSVIPGASLLSRIVVEGQRIVAAQSTDEIFVSLDDGATWSKVTLGGFPYGISSGVWTGSQFVLVGHGGIVVTSPDGVAWTLRSTGTDHDLFDIATGAGRIVAVAGNGFIYHSTDGITWAQHIPPAPRISLNTVTWGGDRFLAAGFGSDVLTSADGIVWEQESIGQTSFAADTVLFRGAHLLATNSRGILRAPARTSRPPAATATVMNVGANRRTEGLLPVTDPDGDVLTFRIVGTTHFGTLELLDANTGEFAYTNGLSDQTGESFLYTVSDGHTEVGPLSLTLHLTRDPPAGGGGPNDGSGGGGPSGPLCLAALTAFLLRRTRLGA